MTRHSRAGSLVGLVLVAAAGFGTACYSQSGGAPAASDPCAGSADEATLLRCRQAELSRAETALEGAAAKLAATYRVDEPPKAEALMRAHEAWRRLREADCVVDTWDSRGGTAFEVYRLDCMTTAAKARLVHLQALADAP